MVYLFKSVITKGPPSDRKVYITLQVTTCPSKASLSSLVVLLTQCSSTPCQDQNRCDLQDRNEGYKTVGDVKDINTAPTLYILHKLFLRRHDRGGGKKYFLII